LYKLPYQPIIKERKYAWSAVAAVFAAHVGAVPFEVNMYVFEPIGNLDSAVPET
jgi:hypothetical protein